MWDSNRMIEEDLNTLASLTYIPWNVLKNKTFFVTGATGLIGKNFIKALVFLSEQKDLHIKVIALVRDIHKAERIFKDDLQRKASVRFLIGEIETFKEPSDEIHYIIHGASPTQSRYFVNYPVETIKSGVLGTIRVLELAKAKKVESFVYLSSMEVYGAPKKEKPLKETDIDYMNPLIVRNCYPETKRLCENMCVSYAEEYSVPAKCMRLAQTFGPGVEYDDTRVFAEFGRCAIENRDITLLTEGKSKRCYLYTMDAVSAILTVLLNGKNGESYNAANPETYCSILEMAKLVADDVAEGNISICCAKNKTEEKKYSLTHFYNLDCKLILDLGWKPLCGLREMYLKMMY